MTALAERAWRLPPGLQFFPYPMIEAMPSLTVLGWSVIDDFDEGVRQMGLRKFGTGDGRVTETEGPLSKTASGVEFTDEDREALRRENEQADGEEG